MVLYEAYGRLKSIEAAFLFELGIGLHCPSPGNTWDDWHRYPDDPSSAPGERGAKKRDGRTIVWPSIVSR
jgi:hypothetical protein